MVAVDIETLPGDEGPIVWCIGFASEPDWAFTIPIIKDQRLAWTVQEEAKIWIAISKVFLNPNLKKVFQGGLQYDLPILGRYYGLRLAKDTYEDTMWCHHATYPYLRKALETLCSIYTWEPYYKDEGKHSYGKRGTDQAEFLYNTKDSCVTREILPITWRNAKELGFWEGYRRTLSVAPSHLGMMLRGIRIDMKAKDKLSFEFQQKKDLYHEKLKQITGQEYNMNSNPQLQKLLYGYYNMPLHYNHKTKKVTTDQDAIAKLKKKYKKGGERFNVLDTISNFRKFSKLSSTYTGMEVDIDGRIHTTYKWVSTWRTSSSESPFGSGGNLQNIPNPRKEEGKMVRKLFIPDEGMELLAADYSQAEARVVDWEAENLVNMEAYEKGLDVHWEKTKATFSIPSDIEYKPKELYQDSLTREEHTMYMLRYLGKTVKHAGNYGEGPFMLQNTLAREGFYLDVAVCKILIQQTKRSDPMTVEWQRKIRDKIRATRELVSSFGRKRRFLGRMNDNLWRAAYAFSPQNTVGELLQVALQNVWSNLDYVEVLLNVHDEIVCQIKPSDRERAISDIREQMTIPLVIHDRELIIPVDFKVGPNWGEMEELDV
jgi:DNA polymerase-1